MHKYWWHLVLTSNTLIRRYLLQDPDSEIDVLQKHVLNTEAHPLRILPDVTVATS